MPLSQSSKVSETQAPAPATAPAPRKGLYGSLKSVGKGFLNRVGIRTSSKNRSTEEVAGGRRRTRKIRKSKTHKRRSQL
jgi:hypothetical protein